MAEVGPKEPAASKPKTILICTVGGSRSPIRTAIRSLAPGRVVFLVSAEGGSDGRGSAPEAEALASELGLPAGCFEIESIAADDPDGAGIRCAEIVRRERRAAPSARLVCDYTGGTKTMSAALMLAAIAEPEARIDLQFMRGERRDLNRIAEGTERPVRLGVDALLAERALERADRFWRSGGYAEAEAVLRPSHDDLEAAEHVPQTVRRRLARALHASAMLAAWDRFEHRRALALLNDHGLGQRWPEIARLREPLQRLAHADADRRMPLLLLDLWQNARRRAARGQYDDAVARAYRLLEATVQYLHARETGIDTSAVDLSRLPEASRAKWEAELGPKRQAGLVKAWALFLELRPQHPIARALATPFQGRKPLDTLQAWIRARNDSLLAHGFVPVGEDRWREVEGWIERHWCATMWPAIGGGLDLPAFPTSLSGLTDGL